MKRVLLHLSDSVNVNAYGLCIAIGMVACLWFVQRHDQFKKLNLEPYFPTLFFIGFLSALVGGRALYCFEMGDGMSVFDIFAVWEGGFSVLGSVIGFCAIVPVCLIKYKIPLLPFFDLIALHAPLLQSLSRIGCFFAGCCYGKTTDLWCGVTYSDTESMAPLYMKLHPTQLYSAVALLLIFLIQYFVLQWP
jgi:phosphatidylglycerol---prolipoprotein diacylglyceryl transferase